MKRSTVQAWPFVAMRFAMRPVILVSLAAFVLASGVERGAEASGARFDPASAPGLSVGCSDRPGQHRARRPNAPVELGCAFALPAGSAPILNGTKSWVDDGLYYLTEVANGAVFIFDAYTHDYVGKVTGFVGSTGTAATSGPNSIAFTGDGKAWVSDGISAVRVVDLASRSIETTISTAIPACDNGTVHNCQRTNEITFDPENHIVFVQNPSPLSLTGGAIDTYGTFISSDPPYTVLGTITFPDRRGQEAPLWDPDQHRIITTVSGRVAGSTVYQQYVAIIDPTVRPFAVERQYDVDCTALGLTGTGGARLFGINDPSLGPDENMVLPACGRALIMNAVTGAITVMPVGGGNETWYNAGDGNFYVTGMNFGSTPPGDNSLGVIDARSSSMLQYVPAIGATNPASAAGNNQTFAVVPASASANACTAFSLQASGCILVFAHVPEAGQ